MRKNAGILRKGKPCITLIYTIFDINYLFICDYLLIIYSYALHIKLEMCPQDTADDPTFQPLSQIKNIRWTDKGKSKCPIS